MASIKWKRMSVSELSTCAQAWSPQEAKDAVKSIGSSGTDWEEKVRTIIEQITNKEVLTAVGTVLTPPQFYSLLGLIDFKKMSPILVGVPHDHFRQLLVNGTQEQLRLLKQQSMSEPLQHQITLYTHEINAKVITLGHQYEKLNFRIEGIDPSVFEPEERLHLWQELCALSQAYHELMHECSIVLLFAWNTDRADLIDQLTISKEKCHRVSRFGIGFPASGREKSSAMFKRFEEKLFSIYGNIKDLKDLEALSDDEDVMEGLTKFSLWHVRDYWELGLLPNIHKVEELDLDPKAYDEKKRIDYRNLLLRQVQENLAQLGLETVSDLKKNWIYSRKSLCSYLEAHKVETK